MLAGQKAKFAHDCANIVARVVKHNHSTYDDPIDYELDEYVEVYEQEKANFRTWKLGKVKAKTDEGYLIVTANGRAKDYAPYQVRKLWDRLREDIDDSDSGDSCE